MFEQSRTNLKVTSVKKPVDTRRKTAKESRIAKELEGTITLEEYRKLLIKAYHDLHKDDNI